MQDTQVNRVNDSHIPHECVFVEITNFIYIYIFLVVVCCKKQSFLKLLPIKKSVSLHQRGDNEAEEREDFKLDILIDAIAKLNRNQYAINKTVNILRRSNGRIEMKLSNQ